MSKVKIDVKTQFKELKELYASTPQNQTFNALISGDFGTGKTYLARTCPGPVFIDSFDPGGTVSLRKEIDEGKVIVDTRWEREESERDATIWYAWEKAFRERKASGFFDHVGTYFFDSLTTSSGHIMAAAMRKNSKNTPITQLDTYIPQIRDYQVQMLVVENIIKEMTSLPCHFICTAHLEQVKNEDGATIEYRPMVTGKLAIKLPQLFDEVYVAETKEMSSGLNYRLLTRTSGLYKARSRLAGAYPLDKYEDQNIKELLKKCKFPYEDKPSVAKLLEPIAEESPSGEN